MVDDPEWAFSHNLISAFRTNTLDSLRTLTLPTEGGLVFLRIYRHGPPDGGRTVRRRAL